MEKAGWGLDVFSFSYFIAFLCAFVYVCVQLRVPILN